MKHIIHIIFILLIVTSCGSDKLSMSQQFFEDALSEETDSLLVRASELYVEANGDKEDIILAKILSAYYYWDKYELDTAKVLLTECDQYYKTSSESGSINHGRVKLYSAMVDLRKEDLQSAREKSYQALEIFEEHNHLEYVSKAHNILGGIENAVSNYSGALNYYLKAYQISSRVENFDKSTTQSILSNLSHTYKQLDNDSLALSFAFRSLEMSKQSGRVWSQINTLNTIGTIYSKLNLLDSALFYFKKSGDISLENDIAAMAYLSEYNIANMLSNANEIERSKEIVEKLNQTSIKVSKGFLMMTKALEAKNNLYSTEYSEAILNAKNAFKHYQKSGMKFGIINISETLWKSYDGMGNSDSALHYAMHHYSTKDSLRQDQEKKEIADLRVRIETIEKQNEIDELEAERKLGQIKLNGMIGAGIGFIIISILGFVGYHSKQQAREAKLTLATKELEKELEKNKVLLSNQTLNMIHRNNGFEEIENSLKELPAGKSQKKIKNIIKVNKSLDKDWDNFNSYFSQVHTDFYKVLTERHNSLSINEKRLATLIKLNLSNHEISTLMNIESKSIRMAKYRLKKKLDLLEDEDINDYLNKI